MILMFFAFSKSTFFIERNNNAVIKRMKISTKGLLNIIFSDTLALFISGSILLLLVYALNKLIFNLDMFSNSIEILVMLCYIFFVSVLGEFTAIFFKDIQKFQVFSIGFSLVTGFVSGSFWDFTKVSEIFNRISLFTPQGLVLNALKYTSQMQSLFCILMILSSLLLMIIGNFKLKKHFY